MKNASVDNFIFNFDLEEIRDVEDLDRCRSPVTPDEHLQTWTDIANLYCHYLSSSMGETQRVLKAIYKLNLFYFQKIYPFIVHSALDQGSSNIDQRLALHVKKIMGKGENYFDFERKIISKETLSYIKKNILRISPTRYLKLRNGVLVAIVGGSDHLIDYTLKVENKYDRSFLVPAWIGLTRVSNFSVSDTWKKTILNYSEDMNAITKRLYPSIHHDILSGLQQFMIQNLRSAWKVFKQIETFLNDNKFFKNKEVVVSPLGNNLNKLFCEAYRHTGGYVRGFSHGNIMGRPVRKAVVFNEMAHCDTFTLGSPGAEMIFQHALSEVNCNAITKSVHITRVQPSFFKKSEEGTFSFPIKTIMVIGPPHSNFQHPDLFIGSGIKWLYLEVSLLKELKKHHLRVIYKMHPESKLKNTNILSQYADQIETAPYESVFEVVDCIVGITFASTTYSHAAMCNKPFILIETPQIRWEKELYLKVIPSLLYVRVCLNRNNMFEISRTDLDATIKKLKDKDYLFEHIKNRKKIFYELNK